MASDGKDRRTNIALFVILLIVAAVIAYWAGPFFVAWSGGHK